MRSLASSSCIAAGLGMWARAWTQVFWASSESQAGTSCMRNTWHNKPGVPSGKCDFRSRTPASSDVGTGRMAAHAFGELNKGSQPLTQTSALSFMALTTRTGRSSASSRRRASARSSLREGPVVCMRFSNNMQGMPNSRICKTKNNCPCSAFASATITTTSGC